MPDRTSAPLVADYQPGIFEGTLLLRALATGIAGWCAAGLAIWMPHSGVAWLCLASAVCLLLSGCVTWWTAFQTLRMAGPRSIDLTRRLIAYDGGRRFLAGSTVEIEDRRLGRVATFRRLTLAWPDGTRLPLAQGTVASIHPLQDRLLA